MASSTLLHDEFDDFNQSNFNDLDSDNINAVGRLKNRRKKNQ